MNRLFRPTIAALAGLTASATVASANVEIGGTAGIHVFSTTNELGVPDVDDAASERNSALFGLRLGFTFNDMLGVEGEFGVIPSETRGGALADVWNLTYRGHLIAQFGAGNPAKKLIPFILAGGGATAVVKSKNEDIIEKDTDAALYAGVGAKYRVDNGWGLRADARLLFPPSSTGSGPTVDFEALLSIYKEFGRKTVEKVAEPAGPNDTDGDGLTDDVDKCPNEAEDKDGFQDDDGCPDPDNDGDGVMDASDKCVDQPETKNGYQDEDGCPDEVPQKVKQFTGVIQGINFKTNDASLLPASNKTLDKAVAVLKEFGDLKLEVQGHTDDQPIKKGGKFTDNKELSQARAETVKAYFVGKGIEEGRISAVGYGSDKPVVDPAGLKGGKLTAARAKNRRVEFKLVSNLVPGDAAAPAPAPEGGSAMPPPP